MAPTPRAAVGAALAPPPSDIDEVAVLGAPFNEQRPLDESLGPAYAGGFDKWTSPEARTARANRVSHTATPLITLYNVLGEDRSVSHADLALLTDPTLAPRDRLYVRCPRCEGLPNRGLHPHAGPNGCPAKPSVPWMACPICQRHGLAKRVYAEAPLEAPVTTDGESDPNEVAPDLPSAATTRAQLQDRLYQHMTAFHASETQSLYRVRREPNGHGFRIVQDLRGDPAHVV